MNRHRALVVLASFALLILSACGSDQSAKNPASDASTEKIEAGKLIFQANCAACHATESENVLVGPSMVGLLSRAGDTVSGMDAEAYIQQSILEPSAHINEGFQNLMPETYQAALSDEELDALLAYLFTFE